MMLSACEKEPIKIGFIGSLTSKNSQPSIDARNAILLGIDQVNALGGVDGRLIELVVKDDGADTNIAIERHNEFIKENVKLVLGHMTSNMSTAVLKSQSDQLLFISPTMGSSNLQGLDDYFIRMFPLTNNQAVTFLELVDVLNVQSAIILYDVMNAEYTENMAKYAEALNSKSKRIQLKLMPFDSRTDDLKSVANQIVNERDFELVLFISQAIDTAILAQVVKNERPDITLCSVFWSMTEDLILNGGDAIEEMYFIGLNKSQYPSDAYINFQDDFYDKYQYRPSSMSALSYDAFNVLIDAIEISKEDSPVNIKNAILKQRKIEGLEEAFEIDRYGDNNRTFMIYQLIDNDFVPLYN